MIAKVYLKRFGTVLFFILFFVVGMTEAYGNGYFSVTPDIQMLHITPGATVSKIQFVVKNTSGVTLHQVAVEKDKPVPGTGGFSALLPTGALDRCQGDLPANQTCRFALQVTAPYGSAKGTIAPKVCSEGVLCDSGSLPIVSDSIPVKKAIYTVTTALPQTVPVNKPFPIVVNVTNPNTNYPLTGLDLTYDNTYFTITQNDCHNVLLPGSSCALSGDFQSPTPGAYYLFMHLDYNEDGGTPIDISTKGVVSNIAVVGQTILPLPADVVPGYQYPVIFQYTNYGNKEVTDVGVQTTQRSDFTGVTGSCPGLNGAAMGTLAAGASCLVEGTLTPQAAGSDITLSSTLTYAGQIQSSVLYTTTESSNVAVNAEAAIKLPDNMAIGDSYPFLFTFTNTSDKLSVSNLNFIKTLQHTSLTSDTCAGVTSLAKGASCDIGGNYTPTIEGPAALSVNVQYGTHNHLITTKTHGTVTKVAVTGKVLIPLPANIATNSAHKVTFQFRNTGSAPATGLTWIKALPDFQIAPGEDTCSATTQLAARVGHCEITGTYAPTTTGTKALSVKLAYNESAQDINLVANTNVNNVVVTGTTLTPPIPTETKMGESYHFGFKFTNSSSQPATEVHVILHLPYTHDIQNTCTSSLPGNNGKCEISGNYVPIYPGYQSLNATFIYKEGNQVKVINNVHTTGQMTYYYDFIQNYLSGNTLSSPLSGLPALNLVNSPTIAQPGPLNENNAIHISNSNQSATTNENHTFKDSVTFDFWVKWNSFAAAWSDVFRFMDKDGSNNLTINHHSSDSGFQFVMYNQFSLATHIRLDNFWFLNNWVHIAVNVNKYGKVSIYRDGNYINLQNPSSPIKVVTNKQDSPMLNKQRSPLTLGVSRYVGQNDIEISNFKIFEGYDQ